MTSYLRYKQHLAVLDADDTDIESWITVRGNHIPIKKGQSKEDAVKSFLESKSGNSSGTKTESFSQSKKISWADTSKFFNKAKKKYDIKNHLDKDKNLIHTFYEKGTGNIVGEYNNTTHTLHYNEEPDLPAKETEAKQESKEVATKYLKRAMNGVGKEKWEKMSYAEREKAINKEKDYYRTEGRNLYFDTEKGYGIRTDDPDFEKQFFEEYTDADKEDFKDYVKGFNGVGMTNEENKKQESSKKESKPAKTESKPETKKTEFESVFGNSSWNAHKDWASYVDNDYRIEVIKENGGYYISKFDIDDYDGSDPEMEEYANTIEEAKQVAEKIINKSQPLSKEEKITKAQKVRNLMNSSIRFEKEGKKFRITGLYSGGEVELNFEKLTGQSPNQSVEYRVKDGILHINDYYGRWHKKIDFSKLDDNEIADMIIK